MKRSVVLLLIAMLLVFVGTAEARQKSYKKTSSSRTEHKRPSAEKREPFKAFIVFEPITGKVLDGENIHEKRAPASVTKLMVALIVLEKINRGEAQLTDKITVSKEASKMGGSQVYLKEGETFTLEELMKATLIASGNDSAYAVAEYIGGSKEGFVKMMNEKAKALGMADTEFHSVHGLPPSKGDSEDMTSCYDLALLAKELLKHPKALEWTSITTDTFRDGKFILNNHNKLLTKMQGVDGLKTGYYRATGFNVAATAKKGDLRLIVVVMGSPTAKVRDNIAIEKLKKYFSQYKIVSIAKKGEVVDKDIYLPDGKYRKIKGVLDRDFSYPVLGDDKGNIRKEVTVPDKISGDIREGQRLGEMVVYNGNDVIGKIDIISPVYIPKANLFTRIIRKLGLNI